MLAIQLVFWYNNAQRFSADIRKAKLLVERIEKQFQGVALTPYLLLMNGVDHLEAQEDLLPILEQVNTCLGADKQIAQYSLPAYAELVRQYIEEQDIQLEEHKGELREGHDYMILKGTLSSRVYLKQENVRMQDKLERQIEPLYAMLEMAGAHGIYPKGHLRYLWKKLMHNHPHDSICGCSRDEIADRMEASYRSLQRMAGELLRRGMTEAGNHLRVPNAANDDYNITIANTTEYHRSGVIELTLEFPANEQIGAFVIMDAENQ